MSRKRGLEARAAAARHRTAGIDEAGRGPLAGPVVAAAVILDPARPIRGLRDSKQIDRDERARLALLIRTRAVAWSVAWADREEIDSLNILEATFLAMRRALIGLAVAPERVCIDGNRAPRLADLCAHGVCIDTVIDGDVYVPAISAASILAKTTRDALMEQLDQHYPGFELALHKGYATRRHLQCLREKGPSILHRRSFAPVAELLLLPGQTLPLDLELVQVDELDDHEAELVAGAMA